MVASFQLPTDSPKFRYLIKRSYLQYLMVNPFYGHNFTDATMLAVGKAQKAVVTISAGGIQILEPSDWSILFSMPLWDIEDLKVTSISDAGRSTSASKIISFRIFIFSSIIFFVYSIYD
jgi:hypothetical protein